MWAPEVPIIACIDLSENAARVHRAGADFTYSVSQVAGQLLAYHVLGEMISPQARLKIGKLDASRLAGQHPHDPSICDGTGCAIVAVERAGEIIMDVSPEFILTGTDAVYVCGRVDAFNGFNEEFAAAVA